MKFFERLTMNPIIKTKNLSFGGFISYPDIEIPRDKVTFITGESGSGKSTLLKLLNQTVPKASGEIFYEETNIQDIPPLELRKNLLLLGQSTYLFEGSIRENFNTYYEYLDLAPPREDKIKKYLSIACADFDLNTKTLQMSGGERHRIFTAIYLSLEPRVIMLDEPTAALDSENTFQVVANIIQLSKAQKTTVIIVSHDAPLVEKFGENIITLERKH